MSWEEAGSELLVDEGRVLAVGQGDKLSHDPPAGTEILRLPGGVMLPTFFDAHLHLDLGGQLLSRTSLVECRTSASVLDTLNRATLSSSGWIIAIGLHENAWPSHQDLRSATKGHPSLILTRDYHSAFVNTEAIEELGITGKTVFPEGGWQELDSEGNPIGLLHENATRWAEERIPRETKEHQRDGLKRAAQYLFNLGIHGVSDASDNSAWPQLLKLQGDPDFPIRVENWYRSLELDLSLLPESKTDLPNLKRFRVKTFVDGSLGSRSAWMLEDYSDRPGQRGAPVPELDRYARFLKGAVAAGWSQTIHAIGDEAVRWVGELLGKLPTVEQPHRIEHIQHIDEVGLEIVRRCSALASIQPLHRTEDSQMLFERLGAERSHWAYPQKSLLTDEDRLVLGSDWPVVSPDPRKCLWAALSPRENDDGMPGEELTLEQALRAMTSSPAKAAGFSDLGHFSPGSSADALWFEVDPGRSGEAWLESNPVTVLAKGRRLDPN